MPLWDAAPARLWPRTADRAFALILLLGTGVCSAPLAAEALSGGGGFIFAVGPEGRLIDTAEDTSTLRSLSGDAEAQTDRLFLFAAPQSSGDGDLLSHVAAVAPSAVPPAPYPNWTAVGVTWLAEFDFEIKVIARIPAKAN